MIERVGRDVDWKGWKGRRLEGMNPDVDWKGWIRTSIGRDAVAGRGLEGTLIGRVGSGWGLERTLDPDGDWKGRR